MALVVLDNIGGSTKEAAAKLKKDAEKRAADLKAAAEKVAAQRASNRTAGATPLSRVVQETRQQEAQRAAAERAAERRAAAEKAAAEREAARQAAEARAAARRAATQKAAEAREAARRAAAQKAVEAREAAQKAISSAAAAIPRSQGMMKVFQEVAQPAVTQLLNAVSDARYQPVKATPLSQIVAEMRHQEAQAQQEAQREAQREAEDFAQSKRLQAMHDSRARAAMQAIPLSQIEAEMQQEEAQRLQGVGNLAHAMMQSNLPQQVLQKIAQSVNLDGVLEAMKKEEKDFEPVYLSAGMMANASPGNAPYSLEGNSKTPPKFTDYLPGGEKDYTQMDPAAIEAEIKAEEAIREAAWGDMTDLEYSSYEEYQKNGPAIEAELDALVAQIQQSDQRIAELQEGLKDAKMEQGAAWLDAMKPIEPSSSAEDKMREWSNLTIEKWGEEDGSSAASKDSDQDEDIDQRLVELTAQLQTNLVPDSVMEEGEAPIFALNEDLSFLDVPYGREAFEALSSEQQMFMLAHELSSSEKELLVQAEGRLEQQVQMALMDKTDAEQEYGVDSDNARLAQQKYDKLRADQEGLRSNIEWLLLVEKERPWLVAAWDKNVEYAKGQTTLMEKYMNMDQEALQAQEIMLDEQLLFHEKSMDFVASPENIDALENAYNQFKEEFIGEIITNDISINDMANLYGEKYDEFREKIGAAGKAVQETEGDIEENKRDQLIAVAAQAPLQPDFNELAAVGANTEEKSEMQISVHNYINDLGSARQEYDYKEKNDHSASSKPWEKYLTMTQDEKDRYNYLYAKEGKEVAAAYLELIDDYLVWRDASKRTIALADSSTLNQLLFSYSAGVDKSVQGIKQTFSGELIPRDASEYAYELFEEHNDFGLMKWAFDGAHKLGESTLPAMVGVVSPLAGDIVSSISANRNAYREARFGGSDEATARQQGFLTGLTEFGGSRLGNIWGKYSSEWIQAEMTKVGKMVIGSLDAYTRGMVESMTKQEMDAYVRSVLYGENSSFLNRLPEEEREAKIDGIVSLAWYWFGF
ncbi:MAG: hypothetical protein LBN04_05820 [Oscillospiraceae bacterium]|jgi:hypothetical protein|nr:hypothetical protein [Oscillospiraceae bacterium]